MSLVLKHSEISTQVVQSFGQIILSTLDGTIVAVSERVAANKLSDVIGTSLPDFLTSQFIHPTELLEAIAAPDLIPASGKTLLVRDQSAPYYVHVHIWDDILHVKWERQTSNIIFTTEVSKFHSTLNGRSRSLWPLVTEALEQIIGYEQIVILQILDDKSSKIVSGSPPLLGKVFSKNFITEDTYAYMREREHIYLPDTARPTQVLYSAEGGIVPHADVMAPPRPPRFSKYVGAKSIIAIPIILNSELWGLVVAWHSTMREIDFQRRVVCQLLVQSAARSQENLIKEKQLEFYELIKRSERQLRAKLSGGYSLNFCLRQHMEPIRQLAKADGIAIYYRGLINGAGLHASETETERIVRFLQSREKPLLKDNNFRLRHGHRFDTQLPFAGIAALQVAREEDHYIIWFRKETVSSVIDVEETARKTQDGSDDAGYRFIEREIKDTALFWDDDDLSFIHSLNKMIREATIIRAKEHEHSKENLISANNELEMLTFTLSHDLKNPLSAIKLGIQVLQRKDSMPKEQQKQWFSAIEDGVHSMEQLINSTVELTRTHDYKYVKEPVATDDLIQKIFDKARSQFQNPRCTLRVGKLYPVCGEKGAVRQIFSNLVENAVKFSLREADPCVEIYSERKEGRIKYVIADNGIGIPKEEIMTIQNAFQRASNAKGFPGSGIGLALVTRITKRLGATMTLESSGNGTTVTLTFSDECL